VIVTLLVLGGCTTTAPVGPPGGSARPAAAHPRPGADGPPDTPGPDPMQLPDAEPRLEAIRAGGPNKPYEVAGQTYVPAASDVPMVETGLASWYGRKFHGRRTASGETYNMHAMTAAHKTMPIPSYARVRNPANGRTVVVRINDRGPFATNRVIDLSYAAAVKLGIQNATAPVEIERITHDEIRAGLSARPVDAAGAARATSAAPAVAAVLPAPIVAPPLQADAPASNVTVAELKPAETGESSAPPPSGATPRMERARALTSAAAGYWLQLGAFARSEGASGFQQRVAQELDWLSPLLTVFAEGGMHRLQAGPYPTRDQAHEAADRVRAALQLVPLVVERR
jgi:rare lipoprotein A